ncbi:MAG: hypothetical protein NUV81_00075 [bacterium]|nr:hypothetical protein [bacterium]
MKHITQKLVAGFSGLAMIFSLSPVFANDVVPELIRVDASSASETVVIQPDDQPLERSAKLQRAWVVYREKDSKQIWAIRKSEKTKHEIQTLDFFTANNANYHIVLVPIGSLDRFSIGEPITTTDEFNPEDWRKSPFACRLVKVANEPAVYLLCHGKKRVVLREGVFHRNGWEFRDVETMTQSELNTFETDTSIDEETVFDEDVEVETTNNRELRERLEKRLELQGKKETRERLVKVPERPEIYVMTPNGKLRHIKDQETARKHKLDLHETTEVSEDEFEAFEVTLDISKDTPESELSDDES